MWWKPKYTRKSGYLTREGYALAGGELITFSNGLVIVRDDIYGDKYEVVKVSDTKYQVVGDKYEFFLVAE